jgi:hypothetical protein
MGRNFLGVEGNGIQNIIKKYITGGNPSQNNPEVKLAKKVINNIFLGGII